MRIEPPAGSFNFLEHDAELYGRFDRFYGTLWSRGRVDEATKDKESHAAELWRGTAQHNVQSCTTLYL